MNAPAPGVRIIVADDHQVVRTGFAALLDTQPDFSVIGTARDGAEAVRLGRDLAPDVVLMDVRMPGMDGIEATRQLAGPGPGGPRILILTTFDLDQYVFAGLKAGASGFMLKDAPPAELLAAIRTVADGEAVLAPTATRRLIDQFAPLLPDPGRQQVRDVVLSKLTDRERTVFAELAAGRSNREIATGLHLSEGTVKIHVGRILTKLGLRDRVQAVVLAYESGLITPGS